MNASGIYGVDVKKGLGMIGNNKAIYLRLLKTFTTNTIFDELKAAVAAGDQEGVRAKAHALKGVTGNLHMDELYEQIKSIEQDVKDGKAFAAGDEKLERFYDAYGRTMQSVAGILESPSVLDDVA